MSNIVDMRDHFRYAQLLRAWRIRVAREKRRNHAAMPPPLEMFGDLTPEDILRETPLPPVSADGMGPWMGTPGRARFYTEEEDID